MTWNPEQYLKFAEPRLRPAVDLLTRIDAANPAHVVDLGCGAGNVTRLLKTRWPDAQITGIDDSAEMLACAENSLAGVNWMQQSLADGQPEHAADVIYSNAALHWLPDHRALFTKLVWRLPQNALGSRGNRKIGWRARYPFQPPCQRRHRVATDLCKECSRLHRRRCIAQNCEGTLTCP